MPSRKRSGRKQLPSSSTQREKRYSPSPPSSPLLTNRGDRGEEEEVLVEPFTPVDLTGDDADFPSHPQPPLPLPALPLRPALSEEREDEEEEGEEDYDIGRE